MAWTPDLYHKTLLVENQGDAKHPRYKLNGWVRYTTDNGDTYLQPLPYAWFWRLFTFHKIEHVPMHTTLRTEHAGELSLTGSNSSGAFGGRHA